MPNLELNLSEEFTFGELYKMVKQFNNFGGKMKKPTKAEIKQSIQCEINQEVNCGFADYPFKKMTLKMIQDLFNEYAKNNNLDIDSMYLETGCNYDGFDDLYIYGRKKLSPEEIKKEVEELYKSKMHYYNTWKQTQKINRNKRIEKEKQEYERLKKKYGP